MCPLSAGRSGGSAVNCALGEIVDGGWGGGGLKPTKSGLETKTGLENYKSSSRERLHTGVGTFGNVRPKKTISLDPVSDRPCQFMCNPNYFMSFGKKKRKKKP